MNKRVRGLRISESHCINTEKNFVKHVLPVFGDLKITEVNKQKICDFRNDLYKQGYSGSLINKVLYSIKAILESAEEKEFLKAIPKIEKAANKPKTKGILSIDEVKKLFSFRWETFSTHCHPAKERFIGYVGNLLACVTGLRLGEIQGLLLSDLHLNDGLITVKRSWNRVLKRLNETTKNGRERNILIPSYVIRELQELIIQNPYDNLNPFLFFSNTEDQPSDEKVFVRALYQALDRIGIDEAERKSRNITFHSHRHWFNSLLLNAKVPLHKVQSLTGHLSNEMTELYYHQDDMSDVKAIQETLFSMPVNIKSLN